MLDTFTKWVGTLAPFMAPYPDWVKFAFVLFVLSGATFFIGLVISAPQIAPGPQTQAGQQTPGTSRTSADEAAWLTIKGVNTFGGGGDVDVRITATVNGIEYVYPTLQGVEWLQVGPDMAPQTFQLPTRETYIVQFKGKARPKMELEIVEFVSVEVQHVAGKTDGVQTYRLHKLEGASRRAGVSAEVRYTITRESR